LAEIVVGMVIGLSLTAAGMTDEPVIGAILLSTAVVISPIFAGFAAASLHRRAPIIASAAFGLAIVTVALSVIVMKSFLPQGPVPEWFRLIAATTGSLGAVYGGTIRVRGGDRFARWIVA
jgi:hypothetical protein